MGKSWQMHRSGEDTMSQDSPFERLLDMHFTYAYLP
jgi:hypothetical protein